MGQIMEKVAVRTKIVEGPGDWDFIIRGLHDGSDLYFTIEADDGQRRKCPVKIIGAKRGQADFGGREEYWIASGEIEVAPRRWESYDWAVYLPRIRKGFFCYRDPVTMEVPELVEHPVCGHPVQRGVRFCPICGKDGSDMG